MTWLLTGIGLFVGIHLSASLFAEARAGLQRRLGANAYRGVFTVLSLLGFVLIVIGWRSTIPVAVYAPPTWGPTLAVPLMLVAVYAFGTSHAKTAFTRIVRHPQLMAVVLWSAAHLLSNGDRRSMILFGSLGVWAILEMVLINRRDGEWLKPHRAPAKKEAVAAVIAIVVYLVLIALHRFYAGVSPLPA